MEKVEDFRNVVGFFFCKGYESNISSVVTTHKEENFDLLLSSGNIFSLQKNP